VVVYLIKIQLTIPLEKTIAVRRTESYIVNIVITSVVPTKINNRNKTYINYHLLSLPKPIQGENGVVTRGKTSNRHAKTKKILSTFEFSNTGRKLDPHVNKMYQRIFANSCIDQTK